MTEALLQSPAPALRVDKVVAGGDGFSRLPDGRALFVPGAVPDDWVRVTELDEQHAGYARATSWELVTPSTQRRVPACPVAGACGGCDWMQFTHEAQLEGKRAILVEALRRTAQLTELPVEIQVVASPHELGYRSRIRLQLDPALGPGFRVGSSHQVVPIAHCLVANDRVNAALALLRTVFEPHTAPWSAFSEVEIRALGEAVELCFQLGRGGRHPTPALLNSLRRAFPAPAYIVAIGGQASVGPKHQTAAQIPDAQLINLGDAHQLRIAPGAFTQVNWQINELIVEELLAHVAANVCRSFADLYCGLGNFSLPLLAAGLRGTGVESNARSVGLATARAQESGLGGDFIARDVAETVTSWASKQRTFDLVVVDPPRSGVGKAASAISAISSRHLFLCACDPVTFARDLKSYLSAGFSLKSLRLYDMFPQTHHFEVSAWLERSG